MIVVYERESTRLARCLESTSLNDVKPVSDWREFERWAAQSLCVVVRVDWLCEGDDAAQLRRFRRRSPCHPIVLATRADMANARLLHQVTVDEVVWIEEAERSLVDAVEHAITSRSLLPLATLVGEAQHLPRSLREALMHACLAERPVYSVAELAATAHCDRTTLCLQWRKAAGAGAPLRLVDFLALILLLHANRRKLLGRKTAEVAGELGIHEHTLRRLSKRLVGHATLRTPQEDQAKLLGALDVFIRTHLLRQVPEEAAQSAAAVA
ncbi:MAG TPA: hypothetical protein VFE05_20485 [Longimicrobiaceae bacterium]|jgi:hypothetical protein|nr:hypothetical protein [Longimicrobiaceae bacterium]